jgi:hypothetical protein
VKEKWCKRRVLVQMLVTDSSLTCPASVTPGGKTIETAQEREVFHAQF